MIYDGKCVKLERSKVAWILSSISMYELANYIHEDARQ